MNKVRIVSDEDVVRNAGVFLRGPDEEWVDVSRCVSGATVKLKVGEVSRAELDVLLIDGALEAFELDDRTLQAFASTLRLYGWQVEEPEAPEE